MFKISDVWHLELEGSCKVYCKSPSDYQWEKLNYREVRQLVQYHNFCSLVGLRWVLEPFNPKLSCVPILLWQPPLLVCLIFISEKALAIYSSTLAWKISWTEESGRLQSMGSLRVGHDWMTSLSFFPFMHWRRKWQPTPVFLPGESQGLQSLVGCCLWGRTELDMTEAT